MMYWRQRRSCWAMLLIVSISACERGSIDPGTLDAAGRPDQQTPQDQRINLADQSSPPPQDAGVTQVDLTSNPGDPCTSGQCADGLICMANVCHTICSTECGDTAPECAPQDGCHWVTSFSAACMPGNAKYMEECGGNIWCEGGNLCVKWGNNPTRCLRLCKYGCPMGIQCGTTNNGCDVCIE